MSREVCSSGPPICKVKNITLTPPQHFKYPLSSGATFIVTISHLAVELWWPRCEWRSAFLIPSSSSLKRQSVDQACLCSTIWWPLQWIGKPFLADERGKNHPFLGLQYRSRPLGGVSVPCPSSSRADWGIYVPAHELKTHFCVITSLFLYKHTPRPVALNYHFPFFNSQFWSKLYLQLMRAFIVVKQAYFHVLIYCWNI